MVLLNNFCKPYLESKKYFYITTRDIEYYTDNLAGIYLDKKYVNINNGTITIKKGYTFNGASPRFEWYGCEFGTPQGRGFSGLRGFLFHDALYQYGKEAGVSKISADKTQLIIHTEDGFKPAKLYKIILYLFGGKSWKGKSL